MQEMEMDRRALYNSLRMNWLMDSKMSVSPWQVEDYRALKLESLFERLRAHDFSLDKDSFAAFAEEYDSPEELADDLAAERDEGIDGEDSVHYDQIYLLVFELWRRLLTEKPSVSIFCDELDNQIYSYDSGSLASQFSIQDSLANLKEILDENVDEGADPLDAFEAIASGCANDLESFIYDYTSQMIDERNYSYASELLDGFSDYVSDQRWFDFLRARLLMQNDLEAASDKIAQLYEEELKEPDIEFNLEILHALAQTGDEKLFCKIAADTLLLIEYEDDFHDLLSACIDHYHFQDQEKLEEKVKEIMKSREKIPPNSPFNPKDPKANELKKLLIL